MDISMKKLTVQSLDAKCKRLRDRLLVRDGNVTELMAELMIAAEEMRKLMDEVLEESCEVYSRLLEKWLPVRHDDH